MTGIIVIYDLAMSKPVLVSGEVSEEPSPASSSEEEDREDDAEAPSFIMGKRWARLRCSQTQHFPSDVLRKPDAPQTEDLLRRVLKWQQVPGLCFQKPAVIMPAWVRCQTLKLDISYVVVFSFYLVVHDDMCLGCTSSCICFCKYAFLIKHKTIVEFGIHFIGNSHSALMLVLL